MIQKKILHLVHPDHKFIDYIVNYFERLHPQKNQYLVGTKEHEIDFKSLVKNFSLVQFAPENSNEYSNFLAPWDSYSAIITHSLDPFRATLIETIPKHIKVGWTLFGYEFYDIFPEIKHKVYAPETKKLFLPQNIRWKIANTLFYKNLNKLIGRDIPPIIIERGMKRIDFFGGLIEEEANLIKETLNLKYEWKPFTFYNIEDFLDGISINSIANGENILLGNSSTPTNNHFEIFKKLASQELGNTKVIVPLSYGNKEYQTKIISHGYRFLGQSFRPLTTFFEKKDYNKVLLSCNIAIMNHIRQQAIGNIISLIWFGSKVYLNRKNPTTDYLKRLNVHFAYTDEIDNNFMANKSPLTKQQIEQNRNIILREFSFESVISKNRQFINALLNNN